MAVLPSWPTISWSTMAKEDCSMDCNPTGTAVPMTARKKLSFFIEAHPPVSQNTVKPPEREFRPFQAV